MLELSPDVIFYSGIAVCIISVLMGVIAVITLYIIKKRLNKQFNNEYGKRRH